MGQKSDKRKTEYSTLSVGINHTYIKVTDNENLKI